MEIEAAVPVDDSLLLSISVAGFIVLGSTIYWLFYRGGGGPELDGNEEGHAKPGGRAHRRMEAREQRKQRGETSSSDRRKKNRRRTAVAASHIDDDQLRREAAAAAAKSERLQHEEEMKRKQKECFYGPLLVDDLAQTRLLDIELIASKCGGTTDQVKRRIEELVDSRRWAGFFFDKEVEASDDSMGPNEEQHSARIRPTRLRPHFLQVFSNELQILADELKNKPSFTLEDVAKIIQEKVLLEDKALIEPSE